MTNKTAAGHFQIAGLVPFSTVDWPGHICASIFLQGCPWKCPYCHNNAITDPKTPGVIKWGQVVSLLEKRGGLLDGVVFSGGEPLMQPVSTLEAALTEVKELGYKTGMHTGGSYPKKLGKLLDKQLIDWVGLDIKALPADYAQATGSVPVSAAKAEESLNILTRHPETGHEIRLTLWPPLAGDGNLIEYATQVAKWAHNHGAQNFTLQRYRPPNGAPDKNGAWGEAEAQAALKQIGFQNVAVR